MERKKGENKVLKHNIKMENGDFTYSHMGSNIKGDEWNIALLFFLYTLQGIPLGLSAAIPMILQNRGVSYKQQVSYIFETRVSLR